MLIRYFCSKCNYFNEQTILTSLFNTHNEFYGMEHQEVIDYQIIYVAVFMGKIIFFITQHINVWVAISNGQRQFYLKKMR